MWVDLVKCTQVLNQADRVREVSMTEIIFILINYELFKTSKNIVFTNNRLRFCLINPLSFI